MIFFKTWIQKMEIGAIYQGDGQCEFVVWAPLLEKVALHLIAPRNQQVAMVKDNKGYWRVTLDNVEVGSQYCYLLNEGVEKPDPASRLQSHGVHQCSVVIDYKSYQDDKVTRWQGIQLADYIIYEIHVGTFTKPGDFASVIEKLLYLKALGITAIEIMPVAQFPGRKNWGYDGVYFYAVQNSYGGPAGLKKLVNACHEIGLAVILDVVYNHIGPEGNYLPHYAPYFSTKYHTPWGDTFNFDDRYSDGVRNYFFENALYWFRYFDIDALRLDTTDAIRDDGVNHFLTELTEKVAILSTELGKPLFLIAEDGLNETKIIKPVEQGGYGMDAQWGFDFQRALHAILTGEKQGDYADFGDIADLIKAYQEGYVNTGRYSVYRQKKYGMSSRDIPANQFVVFSQTHDTTGNRMLGERLCHLISFEAAKLAAGVVLLSPYIPLLFMGEEYAETNPFCYFIDHSDQQLIESVRKGRLREFKAFLWQQEPPKPEAEETFLSSQLNWSLLDRNLHKTMFEYYQTLIQLRKTVDAFQVTKQGLECSQIYHQVLSVKRTHHNSQVWLLMNFNQHEVALQVPLIGTWHKLLNSSETKWLGEGSVVPGEVADRFDYKMNQYGLLVFRQKSTTNL
jgi:maltooligosyltrehalose trehalohydrolase